MFRETFLLKQCFVKRFTTKFLLIALGLRGYFCSGNGKFQDLKCPIMWLFTSFAPSPKRRVLLQANVPDPWRLTYDHMPSLFQNRTHIQLFWWRSKRSRCNNHFPSNSLFLAAISASRNISIFPQCCIFNTHERSCPLCFSFNQ